MSRRFDIENADIDECRTKISELAFHASNGTHPYAHNLIGLILQRIEDIADEAEAACAIEDFDLNDLGIYA